MVSCILKCFVIDFLKRSVPLKTLSLGNYYGLDLVFATSLSAKAGFSVSSELKCAFKSEFYTFPIDFQKEEKAIHISSSFIQSQKD